MHYENILEDRIGESLKMLQFLGVDPPDWRVECTRFCTLDMYQRRPGLSSPPTYTEDMKAKINSVIQEINKLLTKHGHTRIVETN